MEFRVSSAGGLFRVKRVRLMIDRISFDSSRTGSPFLTWPALPTRVLPLCKRRVSKRVSSFRVRRVKLMTDKIGFDPYRIGGILVTWPAATTPPNGSPRSLGDLTPDR